MVQTFYAEGLGSPALEYYLSGLAVRMAQGKGLHRQPAKSWRLPEAEVLQRNWLWWTIYCLDKQLAFRSGRPSAIDDENISAEIPRAAPPGSPIDVNILTYIIRHAQISTQISRRIMSVKASQQSLTNLINTVRDIHRQLEEFKQSLPPDLQIEEDVLPLQDRQSISRLIHLVYIRFALYGSIMAVHIPFFYPWIAARLRSTETNAALDEQIALSSAAVAAAAPKIILALRSLTINVSVPAWLAFYYPMYAHINMFVQILKSPSAPSAASDLALLDVCAGHFGHIDFVTLSEISFPFAKESANLAYKVVKAYTETNQHDDSRPIPTNSKFSNGLLATADTGDSRWIQAGFEQPRYFDSMTDVSDFCRLDVVYMLQSRVLISNLVIEQFQFHRIQHGCLEHVQLCR
ncbi:uncharacterized protein A1O9_10406 [Exophiala aquamarina CBS 119918]|uniref:Xylanolytic transcriptional activator regulatory domain-containing protein n=1 Tax=Exophiala aquamarina CBS 119918 TaxID=1182545 RepID=A0A072P0R3_9EURO|nr:uncharacterized protein A1O9_10406 [Exophiala aquamarina CBS 119918]KEF53431.1 hypothetical protein A1O9_10406 [Exophiala aquamarina CBS 119918]